jgi:hypothetical protein
MLPIRIRTSKPSGNTRSTNIYKMGFSYQLISVSILVSEKESMADTNLEIVCDIHYFPTNAIKEFLTQQTQCSERDFPSILLQLEAVGDQRGKRHYKTLIKADRQPVRGRWGNQLRNIPGVPSELPSDTPHCHLEAYLRTCDIKDIIDRWEHKIGRTALTQRTGRWRMKCEFPIFSWKHKRTSPGQTEVETFARLTDLQLSNNTGGIPVLPGYAVRPRPARHDGYWVPRLRTVLTNGYPHRLGERMFERRNALKNSSADQTPAS